MPGKVLRERKASPPLTSLHGASYGHKWDGEGGSGDDPGSCFLFPVPRPFTSACSLPEHRGLYLGGLSLSLGGEGGVVLF